MIAYRLTNQQRKQLLVRAIPLRIVIPSPGEELSDDEAARYARAALRDARRYVVSAYQTDIACRPAGGDGLAGVLGQIQADQSAPAGDDLVIWLAVLVVHLDPPDPPRGPRARMQWPGQAISPHRTWPASAPRTDELSGISG